jgi:ABC-type lipoprotein release transport system permease subunit
VLAALAWRNLWRRPQRTLLSLASIVIVSTLLVFMLSFQIGVYATMKEATLRIFDGYAQIQPRGYADDPTLERALPDPAGLARAALSIEGVTAAAPRVNGFAVLAHGERSYGAAVIGVDPAQEPRISAIAHLVREGRYLSPKDTDAAVLGDVLAKNLAVPVGGRVTVLGAGQDGSVSADVLTVVGLYHSGVPELDRSILEMPLARAQETFDMQGQASTIALGGPTLARVDAALPQLSTAARKQGVAVRDWAQMEPALSDGITLKYATASAFYATLVVVVAFIILNTLLMSVLERTREFGMLLAVGMRPGLIGAMVWMELLALALTGCAIGIAIGGGLTLWLQHTGVSFSGLKDVLSQFGMPDRLYPVLTPVSALAGPGAILLAIAVGGLVPYLRVARLTAATAMRAP